MKKIAVIITLLVLFFIGFFLFFGKKEKVSYETIKAEKGDVVSEVSVTGRLKRVDRVDLSFLEQGKLNKIYYALGDEIKKGDLLASLDLRKVNAQLNQKNADLKLAKLKLKEIELSLNAERINLKKLKKGTREEEINIAKTDVQNAEKGLKDAQKNLLETTKKTEASLNSLLSEAYNLFNDSFLIFDDALKKSNDSFFNKQGTLYVLNFNTYNPSYKYNLETKRDALALLYKDFKNDAEAIKTDRQNADKFLLKAKKNLIEMNDFLSLLSDAVGDAISLSSTQKDSFNTTLNSQRTSLNAKLSSIDDLLQRINLQKITNQNNITLAQMKLNEAQSVLNKAKKVLELKLAGSRIEDIKIEEQKIKQLELSKKEQELLIDKISSEIKSLKLKKEDMQIFSPIDGKVIFVSDKKPGEIVRLNEIVVSVAGKNNYYVEANISEIDIAKIKSNQKARISLDAFPELIFEGYVRKINTTEKILEGVVTYKTDIDFVKDDKAYKKTRFQMKPNMTANLDILIAKKSNVLRIPQRAVFDENGERFVKVLLGATPIKRKVKTGLEGSFGYVEVLEGLNVGDEVVLFEK